MEDDYSEYEQPKKSKPKEKAPKFEKPSIVKGKFFIRSFGFNEEKQRVEYVVSPTDPDKRDQEITLSILQDESVDKSKISKALMENREDVIELAMVQDKDSTHAYAYDARGLKKDKDQRMVLAEDKDGNKKPAFNWTDGVDNAMDKIHGYGAKKSATENLLGIARDPDCQRIVASRARTEAAMEMQRLDPSMSREAIDSWLEKNFDPAKSVTQALQGQEIDDKKAVNRYYNSDYSLGAQMGDRNWKDLPNAEKASCLNNYSYQRAIQGLVTENTMAPQMHNGHEVTPHEKRELDLVSKGQLFAANPSMTPELRIIEDREFAEREAGKATRLAMAMFGAEPAAPKFDDVCKDDVTRDGKGNVEHKTLSGELLATSMLTPEMGAAKKSGDELAQLSALSRAVGTYSERSQEQLIHGKNGLIDEQDEKGAVLPGFNRNQNRDKGPVDWMAKKVGEHQKDIHDKLPKLGEGLKTLTDSTVDGPSFGFVK